MLLIRRIRELLYEQGFTISGARNRLSEASAHARDNAVVLPDDEPDEVIDMSEALETAGVEPVALTSEARDGVPTAADVRNELLAIRALLVL